MGEQRIRQQTDQGENFSSDEENKGSDVTEKGGVAVAREVRERFCKEVTFELKHPIETLAPFIRVSPYSSFSSSFFSSHPPPPTPSFCPFSAS